MVSSALCREQRRGIWHAAINKRGFRLGQTAVEPLSHGNDWIVGLLHPLPHSPRGQDTKGCSHRSYADFRRCCGQSGGFDVLWHDIHRIDTDDGSHAGRGLQHIPYGQGGGYVLFPAVPMGERAELPIVSGGLRQLFLWRDIQPGRCIHIGGGGLSDFIPLAILSRLTPLHKLRSEPDRAEIRNPYGDKISKKSSKNIAE